MIWPSRMAPRPDLWFRKASKLCRNEWLIRECQLPLPAARWASKVSSDAPRELTRDVFPEAGAPSTQHTCGENITIAC